MCSSDLLVSEAGDSHPVGTLLFKSNCEESIYIAYSTAIRLVYIECGKRHSFPCAPVRDASGYITPLAVIGKQGVYSDKRSY